MWSILSNSVGSCLNYYVVERKQTDMNHEMTKF